MDWENFAIAVDDGARVAEKGVACLLRGVFVSRTPHIWLSDGDKVLVYTTEQDGTLGSDSLSDAFHTEKELIEHCKSVNQKYLGHAHRKVTVFEVSVRYLKEIQIADDPDWQDWPRD